MSSTELPRNQFKWNESVKGLGLEQENIHDFYEISSASEIGIKQFLLLQVLWTISASDKDLFQSRGDLSVIQPHYFRAAKTYLSNAKSWTAYIDSFQEPNDISAMAGAFPDLGSLSAVRYWQLLCTTTNETEQAASKFSPKMTRYRTKADRLRETPQTPTPAPRVQTRTRNKLDIEQLAQSLDVSTLEDPDQPDTVESEISTLFFDSPESSKILYPPTEDEQIVNTALLLFLNGITMHFDMPARWSLHRKAFIFKDVDSKIYEARVDGYLLCTSNNQVKAIAEVKPCLRKEKRQAIQMQEGAQMAAWISNYPDQTEVPKIMYRRLLISQDRQEIYLTFGTYDSGYIAYVTGREKSPGRSFLRMLQYGPFNVTCGEHMMKLGLFLFAFARQECN